MTTKHLIDFNDITPDEWNGLYTIATDIISRPDSYADKLKGRVLATLFYEPSTRTQFSFQTAMLRLGGSYIGFSDPKSASVAKGETLRDTTKIVSNYADAIVIRSPFDGAAMAASLYSRVPVINAGDGSHLHPTQTMADLTTIARLKGSLTGLKIGVCGDLLNGRTVHSLLRAMSRYGGNSYYMISTPSLALPGYVLEEIEKRNSVQFCRTIEEIIAELDILYMTRIQRERFGSEEHYRREAGVYCLTADKMAKARADLAVLHPLPKVDEIAPEVDDDPRAKYFEQAENGMVIRMALLSELINGKKLATERIESNVQTVCPNHRCITNHEKYLPKLAKDIDGKKICIYCENSLNQAHGK